MLRAVQGLVSILERMPDDELKMYGEALPFLPGFDVSLQVPLPVITPDIKLAISAILGDDFDHCTRCLERVVETFDSKERRIDLLRAVMALCGEGRIPAGMAAVAVVELLREDSILFTGAVGESICALARNQGTPSGLLAAIDMDRARRTGCVQTWSK